ncbi:hypothetical protein PISMIDRAFT_16744 [Pisolithus microcarpus 441]|uniref:Uncharacterized protein n=1 Tax=Pisolithus microcarpus 441 TaxID=765257 RepID=A0A0C9YMH4_9AGAM|nr:hypothetical protein BKA83DRAFT_16744 [Pisolithus microcarpus]KIK15109.1 hypothetical protein PISMIDRAFT_16744 [Pisolithus microcarpus 441]
MQATPLGVTKKPLDRMEKEKQDKVIDGKEDKSIIEVLNTVKATEVEGGLHVTPNEVLLLSSTFMSFLMLVNLQQPVCVVRSLGSGGGLLHSIH